MNSLTRKLTHSAMMIALAVVLSLLTLFHLPQGGSVTPASMAPIIIISLMYDFKWAMLTSFAYSLAQLLLTFYPPPVQDFPSFALVILLDYVIAFSALGLCGAIARRFSHKLIGAAAGSACVILLRLLCSFLSGVLIWDVYAPEGTPVWLYSLVYNSSYLIPELLITSGVVALLVRYVPLERLAAGPSSPKP